MSVTLDEYLGIALGMLGMGSVEFWEMILRDFFLKLHYFNRMKQQDYQATAELIRLQTLTLVNIQLASKDKIKDPKKLWRFPWDEEETERIDDDISNALKLSKLL
ncbi:hypothetical protein [uncultured Butyricimonas sp.]|uniref:hypothetical protein n=1 Tax=uncultured Butyricimonas sp. TaxID=1268785 RepID=UPI0026DBDF26|nr:hypothetical protein [uncultured Butyricimonas sp.]